jgi:hypothetical protein
MKKVILLVILIGLYGCGSGGGGGSDMYVDDIQETTQEVAVEAPVSEIITLEPVHNHNCAVWKDETGKELLGYIPVGCYNQFCDSVQGRYDSADMIYTFGNGEAFSIYCNDETENNCVNYEMSWTEETPSCPIDSANTCHVKEGIYDDSFVSYTTAEGDDKSVFCYYD